MHGDNSILFARLDRSISVELMQGFTLSFILITLTLLIGLKSVRYGLLSVMPNLFPATIVEIDELPTDKLQIIDYLVGYQLIQEIEPNLEPIFNPDYSAIRLVIGTSNLSITSRHWQRKSATIRVWFIAFIAVNIMGVPNLIS